MYSEKTPYLVRDFLDKIIEIPGFDKIQWKINFKLKDNYYVNNENELKYAIRFRTLIESLLKLAVSNLGEAKIIEINLSDTNGNLNIDVSFPKTEKEDFTRKYLDNRYKVGTDENILWKHKDYLPDSLFSLPQSKEDIILSLHQIHKKYFKSGKSVDATVFTIDNGEINILD